MLNFLKNQMGRRIVKRSHRKAMQNLGVVAIEMGPDAEKMFRNPKLAALDAYYDNTQYDHLAEWSQSENAAGEHIPVRSRKPKIIFPYAKTLTGRLVSKMFGEDVFPTFNIEESPDDQEFIRMVVKVSRLKYRMLEPMKKLLNTGSAFMRFWIVDGVLKMEGYDSKYCYPEFSPSGDLQSVDIKYVFTDEKELDQNGNFKRKWFKMRLTTSSEILYDNPEFDPDSEVEPEFHVVEQVDHDLGFVQGEWFRTSENKHSPDGYSLIEDVTDFIDELCYSMSQSSSAISYNQDPQLWFKNMTEEEMAEMIRSATKSWNLGRNGEAGFLESNLVGVERADGIRDKIRTNIQDFTRILLLDPEKIVGSAQSAKAMEVLHGPMVDLIRELRGMVVPSFRNMILKMGLAILISAKRGLDVPIQLPAGYQPQTLDFELKWPPIFQQTMEDLQKKVGVAGSAKSQGLISTFTALKFIAEDFGIEDLEGELKAIEEDQKMMAALNPFGGF